MLVKTKYEFGQEVYLITDVDQHPHLITEVVIKPASLILYELSCGHEASIHYEFEISDAKRYK